MIDSLKKNYKKIVESWFKVMPTTIHFSLLTFFNLLKDLIWYVFSMNLIRYDILICLFCLAAFYQVEIQKLHWIPFKIIMELKTEKFIWIKSKFRCTPESSLDWVRPGRRSRQLQFRRSNIFNWLKIINPTTGWGIIIEQHTLYWSDI